MEPKQCKNKDCRKILPEGYNYKYCEACRNSKAGGVKKFGKAAAGVVVTSMAVVASRLIKKNK